MDTASVIFTEFGDSRASSQTNDLAEEQTDLPAVAEVRMERQTSPVYHTELSADRLQYWRESASIRGELTGNIGFLFGNWGKMPSNRLVRDRVLMQLKRQPAQIVCLAEAEELVEATLRSPPNESYSTGAGSTAVAVQPSTASGDELVARSSFEYLVIRGREQCSILIAVRVNIAKSLKCLFWERRYEGEHRNGSKGNKYRCYSRCMVCKGVLDQSIGHFGQEIRIMAVHMHNILANNHFGVTKLKAFWDWCPEVCVEHGVDVLMGDFNMSLFRVIPEFRSRGATIDLAAWYPGTNKLGIPSADSCGIFCLRKPGVYQLNVGLPDIHK